MLLKFASLLKFALELNSLELPDICKGSCKNPSLSKAHILIVPEVVSFVIFKSLSIWSIVVWFEPSFMYILLLNFTSLLKVEDADDNCKGVVAVPLPL